MRFVAIRPRWSSWALLSLLLLLVVPAAPALALAAERALPALRHPELEYLEVINRAGPPRDPQVALLLMAAYANANQSGPGSEFFAARLAEFGPRLSAAERALYLGLGGVLRAQHESEVPLWHRAGYVNDTVAMLEEARRLTGGDAFVMRWMAGVVYAQLPRWLAVATAPRPT